MDLKCTWETSHRDGMDRDGEGGRRAQGRLGWVGYCRFTFFFATAYEWVGRKGFFFYFYESNEYSASHCVYKRADITVKDLNINSNPIVLF